MSSGIGGMLSGAYGRSRGKQAYYDYDPFRSLPSERLFATDRLFNNARVPMSPETRGFDFGSSGNPYVGPTAEQQGAMSSLQANVRGTQPLFDTGTGTLQRTAAGGYLDVANNPQFKALSDARLATARDLFADLSNDIGGRAAARGNYDSSARLAQRNRAGERVATQAAQDIAQAGWGQYGAERGMQQGASQYGAELNPRLSSQLFGQGEQLRGAEQAGNQFQSNIELQRGTAELSSYLQQRGLDQKGIDQILQYLQLASTRPIPSQNKTEAWNVAGKLQGQYGGG